MIKAIVIEDEPVALTQLKDCLLAVPDIELVASFSKTADALKFLREKGDVDLIFCDIELPESSGLEAARWLKKHCAHLVFVTGHSGYALESYRAFVPYFIVKPITEADLQDLLEELAGRDAAVRPIRVKFGKLLLYDGGTKTSTPAFPHEVVKLIQEGNYLNVHIRGRDNPVMIRCTATEAASLMEPLGLFMQVNRGVIVNLDDITQFEPDQVHIGAASYSVGSTYKEAYQQFVKRHQMGKGNGIR
ncbi:MAG TPA: LytTR family DNA-binding domain-containing protein [Burkholderiaceae bacterium]|nr:LytTR family DNA-binding domain-containing protein [Burkholderiaceae bacterium]